MTLEYTDLGQLYSAIEHRVIFNPDPYINDALALGDIFYRDDPGVYDKRSGEKVVLTDGSYYFVSLKNEHVKIHSLEDLQKATSHIYDKNSNFVYSLRNAREVTTRNFVTDRPSWYKARELVVACAATAVKQLYKYNSVSRSIPGIEEWVVQARLEEDDIELFIGRIIERIQNHVSKLIGEADYKDIYIHRTNNVVKIDVKMDIRIREWYEVRIKEAARKQETYNEHKAVGWST